MTASSPSQLVKHHHSRLKESREWLIRFEHSHADGARGHLHSDTGPANYGYARPLKATKRPSGEQSPYVERPAENAFFDVYLCDGAVIGTPGGIRLLTDEDLESDAIPGYVRNPSASDRMERSFDLTARFHDLRTPEGRKRAGQATKQGRFIRNAAEIGA